MHDTPAHQRKTRAIAIAVAEQETTLLRQTMIAGFGVSLAGFLLAFGIWAY